MSQQTAPLFERALALQQEVADYLRVTAGGDTHIAVSERDVLRVALLLANECTDAEKHEAMGYVAFGGALTQGPSYRETMELVKQQEGKQTSDWMEAVFRRGWEALKPDREWMRSAVELVMSNPAAARIKLRTRIKEATREILVSPSLRWDGRRLVTELSYFALTVPALTGYAIALLLDDKRGYADKLLRCNLEGCDSIFLSISSGKGGRPPLYCTPAHQALAVKLSGPARTEKWRKSKAKRGK